MKFLCLVKLKAAVSIKYLGNKNTHVKSSSLREPRKSQYRDVGTNLYTPPIFRGPKIISIEGTGRTYFLNLISEQICRRPDKYLGAYTPGPPCDYATEAVSKLLPIRALIGLYTLPLPDLQPATPLNPPYSLYSLVCKLSCA